MTATRQPQKVKVALIWKETTRQLEVHADTAMFDRSVGGANLANVSDVKATSFGRKFNRQVYGVPGVEQTSVASIYSFRVAVGHLFDWREVGAEIIKLGNTGWFEVEQVQGNAGVDLSPSEKRLVAKAVGWYVKSIVEDDPRSMAQLHEGQDAKAREWKLFSKLEDKLVGAGWTTA